MNNLLDYTKILPSKIFTCISDSLITDLLNISINVYAADISYPHQAIGTVSVELPVQQIEFWEQQEKQLNKLLHFLTQDQWVLSFVKNDKIPTHQLTLDNIYGQNPYSSISLFSGGLDCLCGIDYSIKNKLNNFYCGYKLNNFEVHFQQQLLKLLVENFNLTITLINSLPIKKERATQRSRSFLFLCIAVCYAHIFNLNKVFLFENGVMSLNPSLAVRDTTKTTHPKTIYLLNSILNQMNVNIQIEHPFIFNTKGTLVNNIDEKIKPLIKNTYTCGMSRLNKNLKDKTCQCGVCIPCMFRKISVASHDNEKYDANYNVEYDIKINSCDVSLRHKYVSSVEYFKSLSIAIQDKSVYDFISISSKYYSDSNYMEKTDNMLNEFKKEIDYFFDKYNI